MSKFKTESGDTINYKAKEITSEVKNWEVKIDTEFQKETMYVTSTKEGLEDAIVLKSEGNNPEFRERNKEAKRERIEREQKELEEKLEKEAKKNK